MNHSTTTIQMNNHPNILNLPPEITIDILSRLPIKTIISCKCVCKKFLDLISTPDFAKSHLPRSTPGLAFYMSQNYESSWNIFEFEDALDLQNHDLHYNTVLKFDPNTFISSKYGLIMECSVDGLFCLNGDRLYVCNPITREYIALPKLEEEPIGYPNIVKYGFGSSSTSGQYKVVRIFHEPVEKGTMPKVECMVYTLGTCSWRRIQSGFPCEYDIRPSNGAFLNGCLHWLAGDAEEKQSISCLDLETETFEPFPPPPVPSYFPHNASLAVIGDCLWFCDGCSDDEIVVWVMKEYGVKESWMKQVVISKELGNLGGLSYETVFPLNAFKDGDILFLREHTCLFYCNNIEDAPEVGLFEGAADAITHTSSFVSLRNFARENVISF